MSILAGVMTRSREGTVPSGSAATFRNLLITRPGDQVDVIERRGCVLAKIDYGILGGPAIRSGSRSFTVLAGEPRLSRKRMTDVEALGETWEHRDWSLVAKARGVFTAAHYNEDTHELLLIADKLGLRQLYYWADDRHVYFATALWIMERLEAVPKRLDIGGIMEQCVMGCSSGPRTPYADIPCLQPAEIVSIAGSRLESTHYFRWDEIEYSDRSEDELLDAVHTEFASAIASLLKDDTSVYSFISGGMDSRVIVAALRARDVFVHAVTFSLEATQDGVYAQDYANAAGAVHHCFEHDKRVGDTFVTRLFRRLQKWSPDDHPPERPRFIWSGDGGSVVLGCTHMTPGVLDRLGTGDMEGAIEVHISDMSAYPPLRVLNADARAQAASVPAEGIRSEIEAIRGSDPLQRFWLYRMFTGQRWLLAGVYETLHIHRMELALPFFDSAFVQVVASIPMEMRVLHRFYTKWMYRFDPVVTSVPWQTYPDHVPCPVTDDRKLAYQWTSETAGKLQKTVMAQTLNEVRSFLSDKDFPPVLNRNYLRLALWAHKLGIRRYAYLFKVARTYRRYSLAARQTP